MQVHISLQVFLDEETLQMTLGWNYLKLIWLGVPCCPKLSYLFSKYEAGASSQLAYHEDKD